MLFSIFGWSWWWIEKKQNSRSHEPGLQFGTTATKLKNIHKLKKGA